MIVRRIAVPLAALMFTSTLLAGPAFAARGEDRDAEAEEAEAEAKAQEEGVVPCPEKYWTVPLQVEGLACVLLLPKSEEEQEKAQGEAKKEKKRR